MKTSVLLKDLKKDDIFYERAGHKEYELRVVTEPITTDTATSLVAINTKTQEKIDYFQDTKYKHYGPDIYK